MSKAVMGIYWDTESGKELKPNETLIINTEILNENNYKVKVTISIIKNYTGSLDKDTYYCPCPNGTWWAKLNETQFIMEPKEYRTLGVIIKAPQNADNNDFFGMNFDLYVENYHFPKYKSNGTFGLSVKVINKDENNNIITDNDNNNYSSNDSRNNSELENSNINIVNYITKNFGISILIFIILSASIIIIFLVIHKSRKKG